MLNLEGLLRVEIAEQLGLIWLKLDSELGTVLLSQADKHLEAVQIVGGQHHIICLSYSRNNSTTYIHS